VDDVAPPARFEREHGCTEAEWLGWLPGAVRLHSLRLPAPGEARIAIGEGWLDLSWRVLTPRQIGMVRFPRLQVGYRFSAVGTAERASFMRYFDLYMQRGGG
jgi:hypothetical protein